MNKEMITKEQQYEITSTAGYINNIYGAELGEKLPEANGEWVKTWTKEQAEACLPQLRHLYSVLKARGAMRLFKDTKYYPEAEEAYKALLGAFNGK